jgi:hypothetical protein
VLHGVKQLPIHHLRFRERTVGVGGLAFVVEVAVAVEVDVVCDRDPIVVIGRACNCGRFDGERGFGAVGVVGGVGVRGVGLDGRAGGFDLVVYRGDYVYAGLRCRIVFGAMPLVGEVAVIGSGCAYVETRVGVLGVGGGGGLT